MMDMVEKQVKDVTSVIKQQAYTFHRDFSTELQVTYEGRIEVIWHDL
jgi:hypothetical protein